MPVRAVNTPGSRRRSSRRCGRPARPARPRWRRTDCAPWTTERPLSCSNLKCDASSGQAESRRVMEGMDGVWVPAREVIERAEMTRLMGDVGASDYDELWRWSVDDLARFWRTVWARYAIRADGDPSTVLTGGEMPAARWF